MNGSVALLAASKAVTLLFGGALTGLAARAYRRTGSPALRALSIGIGLVTLGAITGGVLHQAAGLALETSVIVQSVFTAVGFAVLTYSLSADPPRRTRTRTARDSGRTADD